MGWAGSARPPHPKPLFARKSLSFRALARNLPSNSSVAVIGSDSEESQHLSNQIIAYKKFLKLTAMGFGGVGPIKIKSASEKSTLE